MGVIIATRELGQNVPQNVRRRRRQVHDVMRRLGTPVLVKHMYNAEDVLDGVSQPSPTFDPTYGSDSAQTVFDYGIGYVSTQLSTNEWYPPDLSQIVTSATSPAPGWIQAPLYRGFGPGYLCYVIMPDAAVEVFKQIPGGALIKVQTATGQAPWYPKMGNNDLFTTVTLDDKNNIVSTHERYQLKEVMPITMRGVDKRGRKETTPQQANTPSLFGIDGNRYLINQTFQLTLLPKTHPYYNVETDR